MKNLANDLILKILEMPGVADSLRKSLVNRDVAIEIDGKRYQLMKKRNDEETEKLKVELTRLKSRLYDLEIAAKALLEARGNDCPESERLNDIVWNQ